MYCFPDRPGRRLTLEYSRVRLRFKSEVASYYYDASMQNCRPLGSDKNDKNEAGPNRSYPVSAVTRLSHLIFLSSQGLKSTKIQVARETLGKIIR